MSGKGKLVLVRHGESTWNSEDRFAGATDVPLTDRGIAQACNVGELLKDELFDIAYTSMLQRAIDTLAHMMVSMPQPAMAIRRSKQLNERNFGSLEGLRKEDLIVAHGHEQVHRWRFAWDEPMPNAMGERFVEMAERVIDFYESEIAPEVMGGKNILIVAHGQVLRAISMHLERAGAEQAVAYMMENAQPRTYHVNGKVLQRL